MENNGQTKHGRNKTMRDEYDFSNGIKNPYAKELKKTVTIKIAPTTIDFFKEEAVEDDLDI